jgi:hypothetical protein
LNAAIMHGGMDVGIVNAHEMIHIDDVERDIKILSENLVFNKTADATEKMMEMTLYEKECDAARKNGQPLPRKPRVIVKLPRKRFAYDDVPEVPRIEPPAPSSEYAQKKIPVSYEWDKVSHPLIDSARAGKLTDVSVQGKAAGWTDLRRNWSAVSSGASVPASFPYFVRGRDSVRAYITTLFNTEVTMYDGAMGTMIQMQGKWLDEAAYRGERFADWSCNVKGNNDLLSLTQPAVIKVCVKFFF